MHIATVFALVAAMFRSDPAHTGVYDSTAPTLNSVAWRFHSDDSLVSSPVVSGDTVYVGSSDGNLYAVNRSGGTVKWVFKTLGPVTSSPAVANGTVYVASNDSYFYALDANTGKLDWKFKTAGEHRYTAKGIHGIKPTNELMADPFDMFISSPAIAEGTVYFGSGDHHVYALAADSGKPRWVFKTGDVVHATPAVSGNTVYVGSWDRYFYALDAQTGQVRWKFQTGDDQKIHNQIGIEGSAVVANGLVYFGCRDSHLYALDAATGAVRWTHDEHGSWVISSPAVYDGTIYFTTSDEHVFFALDAMTGAERFKHRYATFSYSSPSIADGVAYYGTFDGVLYAVNGKSGQIVGQFETDGAKKNRAAHMDAKGNLDLDAMYPSFTLPGVNEGIKNIFTLGSIVGAPAIADGTIYVSSTDGTLYAIR